MADDCDRVLARKLAAQHMGRGDALGWFDALYRQAHGDARRIPWADLRPNPYLADWLAGVALPLGRALVIGCGLGDDAELLAGRGWAATAFDISAEAIRWARLRFANSRVEYLAADLFNPLRSWDGAFDLVVEIFTLQALPAAVRARAVPIIARWIKPQGRLFVFARGREESDPPGEMPWPLTAREVRAFEQVGLLCRSFEDFADDQTPPVRRFRAVFQNPGHARDNRRRP
jgi:SAM-dependent methyltransferase